MDENTHTISVSDLEQNSGDPSEMKANGNTPPDGDGGTPPEMPSGGGEGGAPPDGAGGGSSSSSVTWSGATEITSGGTYSNQTYSSTTANQNALLINTSEDVTLTNPTVSKTGDGDGGDNSSFYGTNAGVLVKGGSTTTINGGTVTTSANGANGVFSYGGNGGQNGAAGDGTTVEISNTTIRTTGDASGGIMTTGGGTTKASNLNVTTTGQSSAPIRSDRGGGTVSVSGGSYTSSGLGSPAIYSTAAITVEDATLTSNLSEGVCIEGQNSVVLNDCTLTANNTRTNGNAQFLDAVILYQSMSGDSASGTATFTMNGGTLINRSGHVFHVTNTNAVINLNDVDIQDSGSGVLLSVCDDGWSGASNVATLNASGQTLDGDILVGDDSTLTLNLTGGTTFNGNISGAITNNAGTSVSSEVGTVNVSLDSASKWYLDSDVYISSFSGTAANVITGGHTLYVNNSPLSGTTESDDTTPSTVTTALNIANSINNTLIQGTALNDTINNGVGTVSALYSVVGGDSVTINALAGNDSILSVGNKVLINGGTGSDIIYNGDLLAGGSSVTIDGGEGNDRIYNKGSNAIILGGVGNDSIYNNGGTKSSIIGGDGRDAIDNLNGNDVTIDGGADNDYIYNTSGNNVSLIGGDGRDSITNLNGNNATIDAGADNNYLSNGGSNASIIAGDGRDTISNSGTSAILNGGAGDNRITNTGDRVTISGGDGNESIKSEGGDEVSINAGASNDTITISYYSSLTTINAGVGNDIISLHGTAEDVLIQYNSGDGNDTIFGFNETDTLSIGGGTYSSATSGNNIILTIGDDKITIIGATSLNTVNIVTTKDTPPATTQTALNVANSVNNTLIQGTALNDTIYNSGTRVTINALGGNDVITNAVDSSVTAASLGNSINAGDGNDAIYNYHTYNPTLLGGAGNDTVVVSNGHLTYIDAGSGNDSIIGMNLGIESDDWAMGGHATILGGAGADYINPIYANNATIDGGAGNDTLIVLGKNATISGGAGNDRINLPDPATLKEGDVEGADDVLIVYNSGDGNDIITGFTADSTLSIGGASYSSAMSGSNMILTVGNGKITLQGATNLDTVNVVSDSQGDLEVATSLVGAMLYRTEAGYPVIAGIALNPTVYHGDEPTNYASKETWTIESADGLELSGVHYTPEKSNDKWVVIIHGYGHNHKHMWPFAGFYLDNNYNVLMIDQRAAGDSEGTWLTMGTAESADIALWTQEIARRNPNSKITLFGVSMGAATAMMAAARDDTANVTSLVEDCGYSNVVEVIDNLNNLIFKIDQATIDLTPDIAESLTGYNLKDAAPINSIGSVTVPSLFITGTNDSVVAPSMLSALYDASGADVKETFYVEGANHGLAGLSDPIGYSNAVFRFIAEADEEGWETENITDGISLRGTSYNDTITNYGTNVTIDALGGDDFLVNDVDSSVTTAGTGNSIVAGDGNDTIYNHHSYRPTLIGGNGNDSIVVSRGHLTYVDAGAGNDTIIGRKVDTITGSDWEIGGYATVLGGDGNDYINTGYSNSASIDGGDGNDTIHATGNRITINGGDGRNFIEVLPASLDADNACAYIVFNGNTTVDGFKTGWGNGSDTVYIPGDPAGVEFLSGGLTFYNGNDTLALQDVTSTAKVNLYHEHRQMLNRGVFIADNEWYSVESGDLSVRSGEEVYFVGPSPSQNYGVDFSGISSNLNLTLDTAYVDSEDYVPGTSIWINSVHSIRGGAGNTTIIGSDLSDTIIAGTGRTTIDGRDGNDRISLGSAAALVKYTAGDGSDSIYGFNANSTLSIAGGRYSSATSGDDLILTVGSDRITLFSAADLTSPNIIGTAISSSTTSGGGSSSTTSGGGSSSTTSGGGSSSTTSGGGSSSTTSGGGSSSTTSGGGSSSTTSGGGSSSTTSGGGSSSTTSGSGAGSTTRGGSGSDSTTSSVAGSTSSVSGGGSSSTTISGATSVVTDSRLGILTGSTSTSSVSTTTDGTTTETTTTTEETTITTDGTTTTTETTTTTTETTTTTDTVTAAQPNYVYSGGDAVISGYVAGEKIALGTAPTSGTFVDGDLVLNTAAGNLVVESVEDKVVEFTDGAGNAYIKAYTATNPGVIDGRATTGFELVKGSDLGADAILAGTGGSSLNGGDDFFADTLVGGAGTDIFAAGKNTGADVFMNAETKDIINFDDATLSDIVATAEQNGVVAVAFNNGNVVMSQSSEYLSAAFILADGSKYRYNHATRNWQSA